jgi:hypothetical protein
MLRHPVAQVSKWLDRLRHRVRGTGELPNLDQRRHRFSLDAP